jgi:hypothetical protein
MNMRLFIACLHFGKDGVAPFISPEMMRAAKNISMDWNKFKDFLRSLGVEMEGSDTHMSQEPPEEPITTLLQRSHDHEALYRVDFLDTGPELLVLLPSHQAPLKFHFYLVQMSATHPLGDAFIRLLNYQGSESFEHRREIAEWQLSHAMVEMMKALFWAGQATSHFPPEITVQKIG